MLVYCTATYHFRVLFSNHFQRFWFFPYNLIELMLHTRVESVRRSAVSRNVARYRFENQDVSKKPSFPSSPKIVDFYHFSGSNKWTHLPSLPRGRRPCWLRSKQLIKLIAHFRITLQFPRTITWVGVRCPVFIHLLSVFSRTKPRLQVIVRGNWSVIRKWAIKLAIHLCVGENRSHVGITTPNVWAKTGKNLVLAYIRFKY